jgi:beta-lactamase regulating signal transducer with metallopeptidase domain
MNSLTPILDWLLAVSFRSSLLTIVVFLLQAALRRHLTPRMRYALWLPVLIVLLMPVFPQSRWSVETAFTEPPTPQPVQITSVPNDFSPSAIPVDHSPPSPAPKPIDWQRIFIMAWLTGASGILLFGSISFLVTLRRFKRSRHPVSDELTITLAQIAREVHLRRVPRVWIASAIHSPAVTGFLRPTLLLPAQFDRSFTPAEARLVLKHELMHLKRHDLPLNAVLCVLMALHWFNPLLWLAFFKARLDREAACDAQVLQNDSADLRREYGHALLKVETAFCPRGLSLGFVGIFQRGTALRSRIQSIATHKRPHALMRAIFIICVTGMTFLGITRAQQPQSPKEDDPLIAIEIKIIKFEKATDWDFGGRLPSAEDSPLSFSVLSLAGLTEQLREAMRKDGFNITSYPRMVTLSDKEVLIKSVVNHPYKDKDGQIAHLPIGLVLKLKPTLRDQMINLEIDLTDSELIDPATGAAIAEFKGDHPTARSRIYKTLHETRDGQSSVIAGWDDGKPQSKRPLLYVITPHVIKPGEGGLPAGISLVGDTSKTNAFTLGNSAFLPGDSIQIVSVERSADLLSVTADYTLASRDKADLHLYITSDQKVPPFDKRQATIVTKGKGRVTLHHPSPPPGQPHLTYYDPATHKPFGGIYFGTPEEATQSRKFNLSYMTNAASPSVIEDQTAKHHPAPRPVQWRHH